MRNDFFGEVDTVKATTTALASNNNFPANNSWMGAMID